jgi:hypothetical protein
MGKTEEDWNAMSIKERARLDAAVRLTTDAARAKAAGICLADWMKLSNEAKNLAQVERLWTWKACSQLLGMGKTEEDWNAMSIKERARLGAAVRLWTWKACGEFKGTGMAKEDWNALPLDERMKLGQKVKLAAYHKRL